MISKIARAAVLAVTLAAAPLVAAQPAEAASGGGCSGAYPISVCISLQNGTTLVADFYMNAVPDSTRATGELWIDPTNVSDSGHTTYRITTQGGRYGNVTRYIITIPASSGSAVAKVQVRTSGGTAHGLYESPRIYY